MDAFDEIEEQIRRQENRVEAEQLKKRLAELENELAETPVQPRAKHTEVVETTTGSKPLSKKIVTWGKFFVAFVGVIVAIKLATWIGTMLLLAGMGWAMYKLFIESK